MNDTANDTVSAMTSPLGLTGTVMRRILTSDGIRLQVYADGHPTQPAMILIHGYPDNHRIWRKLIPVLTQHFYVIRYDVRGAGLSDRPASVRGMRLSQLVDDLAQVAQTMLGDAPFHLVGHDWGAIQSWQAITTRPLNQRILSLTSVGGASLDMMGQWMRDQLRNLTPKPLLQQLRHSWYVGFFQLPLLPEALWRYYTPNRWRARQQAVEHIADAQLDHDNDMQQQDGLNGLGLYRANLLPRLKRPQPQRVKHPVQLLIPLQDHYILPVSLENMIDYVPGLVRHPIRAGHWVMLTHPDVVANYIVEFATGIPPQTAR